MPNDDHRPAPLAHSPVRLARGGTLMRRGLSMLLVCAGIVATVSGILLLAHDATTAGSYERLAEVAASAGPTRSDAAIDWASLESQNPSTVAWLRVSGTSVDLPVVQATRDDPEHWLYLDFWGNQSDTGTPYLDWRCVADDSSLMVIYGHRTIYADYMFHDLEGVHDQAAFDALGDAVWSTPKATLSYRPLCSASIDMGDASWQPAIPMTTTDLRAWLASRVEASSARAQDAAPLAGSATSALMLVTCNGRAWHPSTRTVTLLVASGTAPRTTADAG